MATRRVASLQKLGWLLLALPTICASAPSFAAPVDRVGDAYEIAIEGVSQTSGAMSSGSSQDRDLLMERVVSFHDGGTELEFDLPRDTSAEDRVRAWQYPVRVLQSPGHALELLNAAEAKVRLHAWLGDKEEAFCGHWVFTWTAIKIDCDPKSVVQIIEPLIATRSDLSEGAAYKAPGAVESVTLRTERRDAGGSVYVADLIVDPELIRNQRSEADVAVAEMTGQAPLSLEVATANHAKDKISGAITVHLETDAGNRLVRRTTVTRTEVATEIEVERMTTTETVVWQRVNP